MLFWQFSDIIIYVKIVGKIPDQHLNLWLFSNPGVKVHILVKSTGQIFSAVFHLFWTLYPGFDNSNSFKCWYFSNNLDIYDYVGKLPEQYLSVWLFSNPGDKILFLLKFNEARISECNICMTDSANITIRSA